MLGPSKSLSLFFPGRQKSKLRLLPRYRLQNGKQNRTSAKDKAVVIDFSEEVDADMNERNS